MHNYLEFIMRHKRPAGGKNVKIILQFITDKITAAGYTVHRDEYDNLICTTSFTGVIFSCHTDTMHKTDGLLWLSEDDFGIVTASQTARVRPGMGVTLERSVLGADDAAGIYIMLRMIEEGIGGTYIFHAAEEIGCIGSKYIADGRYTVNGYDLNDDFTHAIAFDRKGTSDFIYDQLGERMCSGECMYELMDRLNKDTVLDYKPAIGLVTDTAMYADYVQECINLSVGYYDEHTDSERLDVGHVENLLGVILDRPFMFENLPAARKIGADTYEPLVSTLEYPTPETLEDLVHMYPREVADYLKSMGYDFSELYNALNQAELI